jgi:hypothetical protein
MINSEKSRSASKLCVASGTFNWGAEAVRLFMLQC